MDLATANSLDNTLLFSLFRKYGMYIHGKFMVNKTSWIHYHN